MFGVFKIYASLGRTQNPYFTVNPSGLQPSLIAPTRRNTSLPNRVYIQTMYTQKACQTSSSTTFQTDLKEDMKLTL